MIDLTGVTHHPAIQEIVEVLCNKTQNTDASFFRPEVAYFLGKMASCMRATIATKDRGDIPVSMYAVALATSGYGKGLSVNVMEGDFMNGFKRRFMEDTMPNISENNLWDIANSRAIRSNTAPQDEYDKAAAEYKRAGTYAFTFDSATSPAVKQLRHRLLMANCGAINLQMDEVGSNLMSSVEVLTLFLELYDQGQVKPKLIKNTNDNTRGEDLDGKTPANMLLFGTPSKLFDGGPTEDQFYSFLETGYARRCLFGIGVKDRKASQLLTPAEIYSRLTDKSNDAAVLKWAGIFHDLADPVMFGWRMTLEDDVAIKLIEYQSNCEQAADALIDVTEIKAAELRHRYFKALKLAGALAFVDKSNEIEMDHLLQAILVVEESGESFQRILTREKAHVKLAKYIAAVDSELTQSDLNEALPFYKGSQGFRTDLMNYAISWGYKNNIIIKKSYGINNIEFFRGETLAMTDLSKIRVSYSNHWAYHYEGVEVPFEELHNLTQEADLHWTNHFFANNHRAEEHVIPGFNMLVLDVDHDVNLNIVHDLLKDFHFMTYTTKRHTEEQHRFRLLIPINYELKLDSAEYKELVDDVISWMPFKTSNPDDVDRSSNQRSKKWMTHAGGTYHYNLKGELFNILPFIPKTSQNENYKKEFKSLESLDNLERWFVGKMQSGNRNNLMIKYALALVDSGMDMMNVSSRVHSLNKSIANPLPPEEIDNTVMITVAKRFQKQAA